MARPLRIEFPGAVYHVTSRGNARQPVYLDEGDRKDFLELLTEVNQRYNWRCHAYCLMGNHYHLLIETVEGQLSCGMRQLNGVYTQRFNRKHQRIGHLFQGRYKAVLVQRGSHLLEAARYVVLNPVRAHMVKHPGEWPWSSYLATAGLAGRPDFLTCDWILAQCSDNHELGCMQYRAFIQDGLDNECSGMSIQNQVLFGDDAFVESFCEMLRERQGDVELSKRERFAGRPSLAAIFGLEGSLTRAEYQEKIQTAVYRHGYTQKAVADYLGVHYSTVSRQLAAAGRWDGNSTFKT
jgi:REP element-mobilizing transposase RayT